MPELFAYSAISTKQITMAKNIVLVHGGFVDGAGWEGVYKILKRDGYNVSISRTLRYRWTTTLRLPSEFLQRRTDLQFSSATPMEGR